MLHRRESVPRLRARLTAMFLASERRGENLVGRLGHRVTESVARVHATTDWLQLVWNTWRHGDPEAHSPSKRETGG
jgi:hypothetical protein